MLRTKSVHTPIGPDDGLRILVARFRGRGMPKDRYDVWMANLGPSEQLLRAYQRGEVSWREYTRRYKSEIAVGVEPVRRAQRHHQEPRPEVHAAADRAPLAAGQRDAALPL